MSKTKGKKILSLVLTLCMVLSLLPTMAFAAEASDAAALAQALGGSPNVAVQNNTVTLKNNVEITEYIDIKGSNLILDLGNYNITRTNGPTVFDVCAAGASLTIKGNGTISNNVAGDSKGTNMILVSKAGASLTIEGTVTVKQNTEGCALSVTKGGQATLNGGTIVGYSKEEQDAVVSKPAVKIENSTFTMTAGKVTGEVQAMFNSSKVTIEGGTIEGKENGITASSCTVDISGNAKVSGKESGVFVYGGSGEVTVSDNAQIEGRYGIVAANGGTANIEGGTVHGTAAGLGINGTDKSDATFNVTGGDVTGGVAGAYMPAGKLNVKGGTVKGKAGIVVRGGDVDVQGGTIEATGTANEQVTIGDAKKGGATYTVPAAGITVDNAGYQAQAGGQKHVTIGDKATVKAAEGGATLAACKNGTAVEAESGKVKPEENPFSVSGGTFTTGENTPDSNSVNQFLAEDYEYENDKITYSGTDPEVTMDGVSYKTLDEALKSASQGSVIKLLKDVELPGDAGGNNRVEIKNKITIDLNGKTLSKAAAITDEATAGLKVVANGDLTVTDSSTDKAGKITGSGTLIASFNGGKITLDGCTIDQTEGTSDKNNAAVDTDGKGAAEITVKAGTTITANESGIGAHGAATVNIEGGTITAGVYGVVTNGAAGYAGSTVNITGGTITGDKAGMYLPSQGGVTSVTGVAKIIGTDGAGIVVRGGTIEVKADKDGKAPTITANGNTEQTYGDDTAVQLPPAALVVDKNNGYGETAKADLSGGTFAAAENQPSVVYTEDGTKKDTTPNVEISGGTYTSGKTSDLTNVKGYLDPNLTLNTTSGTVEPEKNTVVGVPDANGNKVTVTSSAKGGVVEVVVDGNVSASHSTASPSNTWWAGVGFVAPQNAKSVKYAIDGKTATLNNPILDSWKDGETTYTGFTFWADASKFPTKGYTIVLEWFSDDKGTTSVGKTTYHVTLAKKVVIEPFTTEVVDFGYKATATEAKMAASEGRKLANGASNGEAWTQTLDWADQTMWITFKDPIPNGMTVIVPVTTPSGAVEDIECVGKGTAYTFAWSYKNSAQTGDTSVEVGDYTIDTSKNPVTATQDGKTVEVVVTATATTANVPATTVGYTVEIVGFGFKADKDAAKAAIEATYQAVTGTAPDYAGHNWAGSDGNPTNGIEDAAPNTMWVTFKHDLAREETGVEYDVNVIKDDKQVYTEKVKGVKKGAVVYVSLNGQLTGQGAGEYVFQIVKDGVAVASKAVTIYEVKFVTADNSITLTPTTPEKPIYVGTVNEADSIAKPEANVTVNWTKAVNDYTITYTASKYTSNGGGGTSATVNSASAINGSFTVSDRNAKAGDTVKVTPKANNGYVVDQVTVTDKNGNAVEVKDNGDGTYSFVMPEKAAQPVKVAVTFKEAPATHVCPAEKFVDVDQTQWYHEGVDYVIANGMMNGTGTNTFEPNATTTRAMVVTILYRLEKEPAAGTNPFTDVEANQWYTNAVAWAAENGVVNGTTPTTFDPNAPITREQMAAILYRYASFKGYDVTGKADLAGYTDAGQISDYAVDSMAWANETGLIGGVSATSLQPQGDAIRAQVATILMRFCENVAK